MFIIDALQYSNWSEKIFREMNEGGITAVHVTICYHEDFQEMVQNVIAWNQRFEQFSQHIFHGLTSDDVRKADEEGRTAIFFGFQNCSPIEDNIGLVEVCHKLGVRFMQLSYNNQSLLATGCYEVDDPGITRMGRQVIKEMNRFGLVVDMSHSDKAVTIHPYFKVSDENLQAFKRLAEDLIEITRGEMGCIFYGFTYSENEAYCREGYKDAESLVSHLDNVRDLVQRLLSISELARLEVHGPKEEIDKLREWPSIKKLSPKYYVLEGGFKN